MVSVIWFVVCGAAVFALLYGIGMPPIVLLAYTAVAVGAFVRFLRDRLALRERPITPAQQEQVRLVVESYVESWLHLNEEWQLLTFASYDPPADPAAMYLWLRSPVGDAWVDKHRLPGGGFYLCATQDDHEARFGPVSGVTDE